ncbi:carbohydrate-binding domain-containing protein [Ureibacillus suwonensis]|uniref:Carbohydrate-binding domain-containing protein n=1 Tax=Ureibacillus suwonensis TaxID=313007 RepID=A0ABW0RCC0_9BACL
MAKNKFKILLPIFLGSSLLVSGCTNHSNTSSSEEQDLISSLVTYKKSDYYSPWQNDAFTTIQLDGTTATVDGNDGAFVEGNKIFIRTTGTFVIEGTLEDGQIIIDAEDSGDVRLVLNGATIKSSTSAPIFVKQADQTIISLEEKTTNTLSDASKYVYEEGTDEPSATIYSKDDLTINGLGSLTIESHYNDAIKSNDDLKITGGNIQIKSVDDGIVGKDLLAVKDATIDVTSGGDGLKSSNDEDESKGNVVLESGTFTIHSEGDGVQGEKIVAIGDGKYNITTGGGSPETIEVREEMPPGGPGGNFNPQDMIKDLLNNIDASDEVKKQLESAETMNEVFSILQANPDLMEQLQQNMPMPGGGGRGMRQGSASNNANQGEGSNSKGTSSSQNNGDSEPPQQAENSTDQSEEEDTVSTKGIKAGTNLYILGGTINIDSLDDAVHSKDLTISDGNIQISTGDDGLHGDETVTLKGGNVTVAKSYEGLEGKKIAITGGTYHIHAVDDGVNINSESSERFGMPPGGGFGMQTPPGADNSDNQTEEKSSEDEGLLLIEGGYLYVNADGDGLDSNGSIKMTDGTVIVYGPTENFNGPLDYDKTFTIEGGILVASGSSGMALGVSDDSSQNAIMMTFDEFQKANTNVYVTGKDGKAIFGIAPEKDFQNIVISTPDLKLNQSYTFHMGGTLTGESTDGLYENPTYTEGSLSVDFTLSEVMTYLDKDGVTEGNAPGFGGPMGRRSNQGTTNENNVEEKSADVKSTGDKPTGQKPTGEKPTDTNSAEEK